MKKQVMQKEPNNSKKQLTEEQGIRLTPFFTALSKEKEKKEKENEDLKARDKLIKKGIKNSNIAEGFKVSFTAFILLYALFFLFTKIFISGFYSYDNTNAVKGILITLGCILLVIILFFFIIFRKFKQTGTVLLKYVLVISLGGFLFTAGITNVVATTIITVALPILIVVFERWGMDAFGTNLKKIIPYAIISTLLLVVVATSLFGFPSFTKKATDFLDGKSRYVVVHPLEKGAVYSENSAKDGAVLDSVLLSALDCYYEDLTRFEAVLDNKTFAWLKDWYSKQLVVEFVVPDTVVLNTESVPVTEISGQAFNGINVFSTVTIPSGVKVINAGAFDNSRVEKLIINSPSIQIDDGLINSNIKELIINTPDAFEITYGKDFCLKSGIIINVPKTAIDGFRQQNPEIANSIVPMVADDEVFVNFNITAPSDSGEINNYVETLILKKNGQGVANVQLPFANMLENHEILGENWVYRNAENVYRLLSITANGQELAHKDGQLQTDKSLSIDGVWQKIHTVCVDYTELGGGLEVLGELYSDFGTFVLPQGVKTSLKEGYHCNEWYLSKDLTEKVVSLSDYENDYVVYPKWSLDNPSFDNLIQLNNASSNPVVVHDDVLASKVPSRDLQFLYDGQQYEVVSLGEHLLEDVTLSWKWKKGGEIVSEEALFEIRNVAQNGTYTVYLTATDENGLSSTVSQDVKFTVLPKELTISAEDKSSVYGESEVDLTYVQSGLCSDDEIEGALVRVQGENAGIYDILQGTLSAGDNYTIEYVKATYTIQKATYNMSGISFDDGEFVYNGKNQNVIISGELPTGLDGVQVAVTYEGGATHVAEGAKLTTAIFSTESNNYEIPAPMTAYTTILTKSITVNANSIQTIYGQSLPLTYSVDGLIDGESLTGELLKEEGDVVGQYDILQGSLKASDDYVLSFIGATYTIDRAESVIDVSEVVMDYVYTGELQTVTGATLNHMESQIEYENNTFTTVAEGNALEIVLTVEQSQNYNSARTTITINVDKQSVEIPTANENLVYNKLNQIGVNNGSLYTVEGGDGTNAQTYQATITLNDVDNYKWNGEFDGIVTWSIEKAESIITVTGVETEYVYTGSMQSITSGATLNHSETTLIYENNTFTTVEEGDGLTVTIRVEESDNYKASSETVTINVEKAESIITVSGVETEYVYTGSMQSITSGATLNHSEKTLIYENNTFTTVEEGDGLTVTVRVEESDNYKAASETVTINVEKAESIIIVSGVETEYVYTGSMQSITSGATLNHSETTLIYENNTFTAVEEGDGLTVTIRVEESDNYKAASETVTINVEKAESIITVTGVETDYVYTGSMQSITNGATLNHSEKTLIYENNTFTTVEEGDGLTVTVRVEESDNYKASSETVTINVEKYSVAIPTAKTNLVYSGESQIGVETNSSYTVENGSGINAQTYQAIVTLKDTDNYKWETDFNGKVTWEIGKKSISTPEQDKKFVYTGEEIEGVKSGEFYTVISDGKGTEIGNYTAIVELLDEDNYCWEDSDFNCEVRWEIVVSI